ncbi:hypothetical protein ACWDO0_28020 [Nocardia rhamnosiphila]
MAGRTGVPEIDALIDTAERESAEGARIVALNDAESAEDRARQQDLTDRVAAARRRWSSAKGLHTKALNGGDAERIALAHRREEDAYREYQAVAAEVSAALAFLVRAGSRRFDRLLAQEERTEAAAAAVDNALARRPDLAARANFDSSRLLQSNPQLRRYIAARRGA